MTFSVEHESDGTEIVLLDPTGADYDVQVVFDNDNQCWVRQECPETGQIDLILMHASMFTDLVAAYYSPEGVFVS